MKQIIIWVTSIIVLGLIAKYLFDFGIRPWQEDDGYDGITPGYFSNVTGKYLVTDTASRLIRLFSIFIGFTYISVVVLALAKLGIWWDQRKE